MITNTQMMQFVSMLMNQGDPKSMVLSMVEKNAGNNPVLKNLMMLGKNNRGAEVEMIARNICKEKGMDFDKEFNSFKKTLGL